MAISQKPDGKRIICPFFVVYDLSLTDSARDKNILQALIYDWTLQKASASAEAFFLCKMENRGVLAA